MKEETYVENFEYYPIVKQICMFHDHDHMTNKLNYCIFDVQLEEIFLLNKM
jgi:hypothetical protein